MAEDFGAGKGVTAPMFSMTTAWYFGLGHVSGRAAAASAGRRTHVWAGFVPASGTIPAQKPIWDDSRPDARTVPDRPTPPQ